jgi:serine/threonine protein kinase
MKEGEKLNGRYLLKRPLGEGSMGEVYLAQDESLGRPVAIKTIQRAFLEQFDSAQQLELRLRFIEEAKTSARVQHEHSVTIHNVESTPDAMPFIVMELVVGKPLAQMIRPNLEPVFVLDLADQITQAIGAAWSMGIVHRDLKPQNVIVKMDNGSPCAKILDWGIAKSTLDGLGLTQTGMTPGTPEYMSPEQVDPLPDIDYRADLFAVTEMIYEMLVGSRPFPDGPSRLIKMLNGRYVPVTKIRSNLSAEFDVFFAKALAWKRDDRHASVPAFRAALAALRAKPWQAGPETTAAQG